MKRILLSLVITLAAFIPSSQAAVFTVEDLNLEPGQTGQLVVGMNNTETNLSAFEFKLSLPKGIRLTKNANGKFIFTLSERIEYHTLSITNLADGSYQFICYSMDADVIAGNSGELLSISVTADDTFSGYGEGALSNILVTDVDTHTSSCNNVSFIVGQPMVYATGISLSNTTLNLTAAGQTATLTATVTPSNATNKSVTWTSSNTAVATVSSTGVVTAKANGNATITAKTADGTNLTATCAVTVAIPVPATGISLNNTALTLTAAEQTATLTATVTPSNATDKSVTWTSSNTAVATVSSTGVVTAKANGTATITAKTADGTNLTATCAVTVAIPVPATGISLNQTTLSFYAAGQTATLTATVTPSNTSNKNVTWTSSNTAVATVSSTGLVTAVADGTAVITATTADGTNLTATCAVTVSIPVPATGISLNQTTLSFNVVGQTATLTATVTPDNATNKSVTWASSNTAVATVDANGKVTAVADGTANITATTADGTNLTSTCVVIVAIPVLATEISLDNTSLALTAAGQTATLTATVMPSHATDKTVTWASSNTDVATVGSTGEVTAVSNGSAIITATTADGTNLSAQCTVTVAISPLISFVDPSVKTLCVANWDTNGDGELSEAEAAAVTDLGDVFKNNTQITSFDELHYFTGLTSIGSQAFSGCTGLTTITIPQNVKSVGSEAFKDCTGLTKAEFVSIEDLCGIVFDENIEANPLYNAHHLYINGEEITEVVIPESVTSIGKNAFTGCSSITSVTIPNSVTEIGEGAFNRCTALASVSLPNSITEISKGLFYECTSLTSIIIPESVTSIGWAAFQESGLTSIIIPNSVTMLGGQAFNNCFSLTSLTIGSGITEMTGAYFFNCLNLTKVEFASIEDLCNIDFSGRLDYNNPLYYAKHLYINGEEVTDLVIPNSVTQIGARTFINCSSITSVTIPESITSIEWKAFDGCSSLTSVTIDIESPLPIVSSTFSNRANATLYVPVGCKATYEAADYWSEFKEIIEMEPVSRPVAQTTFEVNTPYYIYNVGRGMFVNKGEAWGTQAILGYEGMKYEVRHDDNMPEGYYYLWSEETGRDSKVIFRTSGDGQAGSGVCAAFVDNNKGPNAYWTIKPFNDNVTGGFIIQIPENTEGLHPYVASQAWGAQWDHWGKYFDSNSITNGIFFDVPIDDNPDNVTWQFVSEADYTDYLINLDTEAIDKWNAKKDLKQWIDLAKQRGTDVSSAEDIYNNSASSTTDMRAALENLKPYVEAQKAALILQEAINQANEYGVDISEAQAVLDNPEATAAEINEATDKLNDDIKAAKAAIIFESASSCEPFDLFAEGLVFENATFTYDISGWSSTTSVQNKTLKSPNNSEAENCGVDGKNAEGKFYENWDPSASKAVGKMYQKQSNLPTGLYVGKLSVFVNSLSTKNNGENPVQFAYLNGVKAPLTQSKFKSYTMFLNQTEVSVIEIGFEQTEGVANWLGIDNASLVYYGNGDDNYTCLAASVVGDDWETEFMNEDSQWLIHTPSVKDAVSNAISEGATASTPDAGIAAAERAIAALEALRTNVSLWKELDQTIYGNGNDHIGLYDQQNSLYLYGWENESAFRNLIQEVADVLDNPTTATWSNTELQEKLDRLSELYEEALNYHQANHIDVGDDLTDQTRFGEKFFKNPDFQNESDFLYGWDANPRGSIGFYGGYPDVLECWNSNFNISQEVELPMDGVYRLQTRAFYRTTNVGTAYAYWLEANGENIGNNKSCASLFANNLTSPIANVFNTIYTLAEVESIGAFYDVERLQTGNNGSQFYTSNNLNPWESPYDFLQMNDEDAYTPNGVYSASYVFNCYRGHDSTSALEDIAQNYTSYIDFICEKGEVVRMGVKAENILSEGWTIFAPYHLIYKGSDPEVMMPVMADAINQARELAGEAMAANYLNDLNAAINAADNAETGEEMMAAYKAINAAVGPARNSANIYKTLANAKTDLENTLADRINMASESAIAAASSEIELVTDMLENGTIADADIPAEIEKINTLKFELLRPKSGDVNHDGYLNVADITALVNILSGNDKAEYDHDAADVNGKNGITAEDVAALVNMILNQ